VTSYTLMLSPAPPGGNPSVTTTGTSYTFRGLVNGTAYSVQVRAHNRAPEPSPWSGGSATETPAGVPGAPSVTAARVGSPLGGQINVSWAPGATNGDAVSGYELTISGGGIRRTEAFGADRTTYAMSDAANGQEYRFEVVAKNKAGTSPAGSSTAKAYGRPGAPGSVQVSASQSDARWGEGWARITWSEADGNGQLVEAYEILRDGGVVARVGRWDREFTLPGLTGGTTANLQVRAVHDGGQGDAVGGSATALTRPSQQGRPTITRTPSDASQQPTSIRVQWQESASGEPTKSVVYRYRITGFPGVNREWLTTGASTVDLAVPADAQRGFRFSVEVEAFTTDGRATDRTSDEFTIGWDAPPPPVEEPPPAEPGNPAPGGTSP
jgi:hypothetical protein